MKITRHNHVQEVEKKTEKREFKHSYTKENFIKEDPSLEDEVTLSKYELCDLLAAIASDAADQDDPFMTIASVLLFTKVIDAMFPADEELAEEEDK